MTSLTACYVAGRFIHFAAMLPLFGLLVFSEYLAPRPLRATLRTSFSVLVRVLTLVGLLSAIVVLALQAGQMGQGWPDTLNLPVWRAVLNTGFGRVWRWHILIAVIAMVLSIVAGRTRTGNLLLLLTIIGMLVGQASVGHAAMNEGWRGLLQRANQLLHLLSAGWWLGGLVPLLRCLPWLGQARRAQVLAALMAFSRSGHWAVALVLITGMVNTWLILGQWPLAWSSPYQRNLLMKIAVVVFMVLMAIGNRYLVVPTLRHNEARGIHWLTAITLAEIALANLTLILVSYFATLEPQ